MIDDSNKCFGNSINQPSFKHVQFSLDFMCMNLAYQKRFLEKQMNVEVVLTLSDDFNKNLYSWNLILYGVGSVQTCPQVQLLDEHHFWCTLFSLLFSLSIPLSYDLCHQNQINHFIQAKCCWFIFKYLTPFY